MPIIKIVNRTDYPVSTSIGIVEAGRGNKIFKSIDIVTKSLLNELDAFANKARIDYDVLHDPDIRDDVEQGVIGFANAVDDISYFVDDIQGTDLALGTTGNAPLKTLQAAIDKIPKNVNNFNINIYIAAGSYTATLKGIKTANNYVSPIQDLLSEPYSFMYNSTKNGTVRLIGSTTGIFSGNVLHATFTTLTVTGSPFVVNEHVGKLIRILDGNAAGEIALIKSNTVDTLEVDFFFNVPSVNDNYEIMDRATHLDIASNNCNGLILIDRCNINNIDLNDTYNIGFTHCKGSIISRSSNINCMYHFMNQEDTVNIFRSHCNIGYGSYIDGVKKQIVEHFSNYTLSQVKIRNCGVAGIYPGSQDGNTGFTVLARHKSNFSCYDGNVDNCLGSFVVLANSGGWIGFSNIGITVPLPNHIVAAYLNSTYNDATGNVFNSILDNILLESGSASIGDSGGGGGVKIFVDEATLLASSENDGTIAYAQLEGKYFLRSFTTWFEHFAPPPAPGTLVGQNLVLLGTTLYTAKIPSGLSAAWNTLTPGDTISNMIVDGTFILRSPDQLNRFLAGTVSAGQSSAGLLDLLEAGTVAETYDIGVNGVGTINRISVTDLTNHNAVFQRANAEFSISLTSEGYNVFAMQHSQSGKTNDSEFYFDDINSPPNFAIGLNITIDTIVSKYLSGIEAIGNGSTLNVSYTADSGIFNKTYHPTAVGSVSGDGIQSSNDNPASIPDVLDQFIVNKIVTVNQSNFGVLSPSATATIRKPNGITAQSSSNYGKPLNTYGIVSTVKSDSFYDEDKRIVLNSGTSSITATPFDSVSPLINGNAQQRHNGILQYPDVTDYPTFSGDQEYQRFISKASASTGILTFSGINYTDIDPYGTGNLNVLIELAVQGKFFDLGNPIGSNNGDGSGNSRSNSIGARNDLLSSGGSLAWSIGTDSTAFNNDEYRLIIIFKNQTITISGVSEA